MTMWVLVQIVVVLLNEGTSALSESKMVAVFDSKDRCEVAADYINTARVDHAVTGRRAVCVEAQR